MKIHLGRELAAAELVVLCVVGGGQFDLEGAAGSELQPQGCCSLGLAAVFL